MFSFHQFVFRFLCLYNVYASGVFFLKTIAACYGNQGAEEQYNASQLNSFFLQPLSISIRLHSYFFLAPKFHFLAAVKAVLPSASAEWCLLWLRLAETLILRIWMASKSF